MKQNKSALLCCLLFVLSSTTTTAQYYFGEYINQSVILRSDFPSKSVLVSNLLANKVGDMSPVIGAAYWADSGRQLECRSLLEFNYIFLPKMIREDPSLITSAELILSPVNTLFTKNDLNKPVNFIVRRVLQNWEDSSTMWINQPLSDSTVQVNKMVKVKNKNYPVSVDVTKLVLDMLRYGNKGFMIFPEYSAQQPTASGQLFASPKNDDENLRPLLVINYRKMADPFLDLRAWNDNAANPHPMRIPQQEVLGHVPLKEPVIEPDKTKPIKE